MAMNATPPGERPRGFVRAAVDDVQRLARITSVLARHGFSAFALRVGLRTRETEEGAAEGGGVDPRRDPADAARRFREMLEELGPTFVKVGQILSTRPDVLPPPFIAELQRLQDAAPAIEFEAVRSAIEEGLGRSIDTAFAHVEPEPLASASMAQTHVARLHDGREVVVKVQRPGIGDTMRSDLDLLHVFARLLEATVHEMDLYAPGDIVRALDEALSAELDFLGEAANLERFAANFADVPGVHVPALVRSHTTRTIMTMERVIGTKVSALAPDDPAAERTALQLIEALYLQIFRFGFFHGDPHPGNLFVTPDGEVAFIDFGLCGWLSPRQREDLVTLIIASLSGDADGLARVLLRMGQPRGHVSLRAFTDEVESIRARYLKRNLREIDLTGFVEECIDAAQRHQIRIASDYAILSKAAVTLEGVIRQLAPDLDLAEHVQPYSQRLVRDHYAPDQLLRGAITSLGQLRTALREVPDQVGQVLMDLESGHLELKVRNEPLQHLGRELNLQTTRLLMGLLAAALTLATPLWLAHEPWWVWHDRIPVWTTLCGLSAVTFGFWSFAWHVAGGRPLLRKLRLTPLVRFLRGR